MGIFSRESKEPVKLVSNSMGAALVDAFGMDRNKIDYLGLDALPGEGGSQWITEEAAARQDEEARRAMLPSITEDLQSPRNVSYYETVLEITPTPEEDLAQRRERLLTLIRPIFEVDPETGEFIGHTS